MDQGKIYLKKNYYFKKTLIYDEIKVKQIECAKNLIETFIKKNKKKKNFFQQNKKVEQLILVNLSQRILNLIQKNPYYLNLIK